MANTVQNLYNIDAFLDSKADAKKIINSYSAEAQRFNDASGLVLARNLVAIDPKIFIRKFPSLTFLSTGISINNTGANGAKVIQKLRKNVLGEFINASDASNQKGLISLETELGGVLQVITKQANSNWDDEDVAGAKLEGINLISDLINAHNVIYSQAIDEIGYLGSTFKDRKTSQTEGLLNTTIFAGTGATKKIDKMSGQEMFDAFKDLIIGQWSDVNFIPEYMANTLVTSGKVRSYLTSTMLNSAAGLITVKDALDKVSVDEGGKAIKIVTTQHAKLTGGDVAVAFSSSEEAICFRLPKPLTIGKIIANGSFNHAFDSKFSIAGVDIHEKKSGRILKSL